MQVTLSCVGLSIACASDAVLMKSIPLSIQQPPVYAGTLPAAADVVVIGGGVIGVCTALFLADNGQSVVLLEKGRIAAEQSSRNWGWIRQQGRDPDELPIMVEANRLWKELAKQTNVDIGLRQGGVTYLASSEAEMAAYDAWLPAAKANGVDSRLVSSSQLDGLIPDMARRYAGALNTPSDMHAEPWVAVPALAALAARKGAVLRENCAVRCLDIAGGRVCGVITETGSVKADRVVLAGGAWSALFLANHGVSLPQLSVRATVAATAPLPEVYAGGAADKSLAFRHRADGGYSLAAGGFHELFMGPAAIRHAHKFWTQLKAHPFGTRFLPKAPKGYPDAWGTARRWDGDMRTPFEAVRVLDPKPNREKVQQISRDFAALFPQLSAPHITHAWAGMIDIMPDVVPVVDQVEDLPGLILGTGMCGHGFGIGPGIGRVLADLACDRGTGHNLSRFRFSRFKDGSKMVLGPSL